MKIIRRAAMAVALLLAVVSTASAQFRFGLRAGIQANALHFDQRTFDSSNRAGFTGGIMAEFTVPVIGVGADASLMYVHRNIDLSASGQDVEIKGRDYIEIPVNLKWRISIPLINNIIRPFVTTGPSFAFLTSKRAVSQFFRSRKSDVMWNFGFGVELLKHLQIGASYGLGLTDTFDTVGLTENGKIDARTRCWTVTAAYLF